MNPEQARKQAVEDKKQNLHVVFLDFGKGIKPIDFMKIEIFRYQISDADIHFTSRWNPENKQHVNEALDWKKEFIFKIAGLCGIQSEEGGSYSADRINLAFKSTAVVSRIMPQGVKEYASASYEYDAYLRAEETALDSQIKYEDSLERNKKDSSKKIYYNKYNTDSKKRLLALQNARFAQQKSDTGAAKRAIIKILKLPTPIEVRAGSVIYCAKACPDFDVPEVRDKFLKENTYSNVFGCGIKRNLELPAEPQQAAPAKQEPQQAPASNDAPPKPPAKQEPQQAPEFGQMDMFGGKPPQAEPADNDAPPDNPFKPGGAKNLLPESEENTESEEDIF